MRKLGFYLDYVGNSQIALEVFKGIADYYGNPKNDISGTDLSVFYDELGPPPYLLKSAVYGSHELWDYDGVAVATSLETAQTLLRMMGPKKRVLYLADLFWTRLAQKSYEGLYAILGNPTLELVARTPEIARITENAWNRKVARVGPISPLTFLGDK
jgi:hypothetical protein